MPLKRKIFNGVVLVCFLCIISGMIAWGVLSHYDNKRANEARPAGEKLVQNVVPEDSDDLGLINECHGPAWKCSLRLDPSVVPEHYDIFIHPDIKTGLFKGVVKINVSANEDVEHIRLHIKDLDILRTTVEGEHGTYGNITGFHFQSNEFWVIDHTTSNEMFRKGAYTLEIEFQGDMTKKIVGIYRTSYLDKTANETKYVVSTKFQPTDARRAFPCFDEPGFKSTFSITAIKPEDLTCISNMPVESEELNNPESGLIKVSFQKSVPMVTYLVAFAIGEFESRNGTTKRGLPVNVYATKPLAKHVEYAASIAPRIVDFYEEYFKIDYPLPKLGGHLKKLNRVDLIQLLTTRQLGMITFRESILVYTPGLSSANDKKLVAAIISHEIAHMWFGNLVNQNLLLRLTYIEVDLGGEYTWYKVNPGYFGLYRIKYADDTVRAIKSDFLEHWTVPDKCGLARDLFSLANGNYSDFGVALEFAKILEGETEFLLWDCTDGHLKKIGKLLRKTSPEVYPSFQKYMSKLFSKSFESVEWSDSEDEDLMKRMIKPKIVFLACEYEVQNCRQQAADLLNVSLVTPDKIPGGLRDIVYKWGMYQADNETWHQLWNRYMEIQDPQEKVRILRGLTNVQNPDLLKMLLEAAQDDKVVRKQDYFGVLKYIAHNPIGNPIIWEFYRNEYKNLTEKFGIDNKYLGRVIQDIALQFSSEEELKEVLELFEQFPEGGAGTNSRKYAIENINNNIHWRSDQAPKVEAWLVANF